MHGDAGKYVIQWLLWYYSVRTNAVTLICSWKTRKGHGKGHGKSWNFKIINYKEYEPFNLIHWEMKFKRKYQDASL